MRGLRQPGCEQKWMNKIRRETANPNNHPSHGWIRVRVEGKVEEGRDNKARTVASQALFLVRHRACKATPSPTWARSQQQATMVEKTKIRKDEVVTREYTINLHKRLHGWYEFCLFSPSPFPHPPLTSRCSFVSCRLWLLLSAGAFVRDEIVSFEGSTLVIINLWSGD